MAGDHRLNLEGPSRGISGSLLGTSAPVVGSGSLQYMACQLEVGQGALNTWSGGWGQGESSDSTARRGRRGRSRGGRGERRESWRRGWGGQCPWSRGWGGQRPWSQGWGRCRCEGEGGCGGAKGRGQAWKGNASGWVPLAGRGSFTQGHKASRGLQQLDWKGTRLATMHILASSHDCVHCFCCGSLHACALSSGSAVRVEDVPTWRGSWG